jgi:hypothetical protein
MDLIFLALIGVLYLLTDFLIDGCDRLFPRR